MSVHERRNLVPIEVICVLAIAVATPDTLGVAALLLIASASRWLRGRGWRELVRPHGDAVVIAAVTGVIAAVVAVPLFGAFGVTAVEWWLVPATQGDALQLAIAIAIVVAQAIALELALRGWIVERMLELSPGPPALPIFTAALAEALVLPGPLAARIGAALFGIGLGAIYVAAGRDVVTVIVARCVFAVGCVIASAVV